MTSYFKLKLLIILSILISVLSSVFIIELALTYLDYPKIYESLNHNYPKKCEQTNNKILNNEELLVQLQNDNGFRNYNYSKKKGAIYYQVLLDTLCVNNMSYRDQYKDIRINTFKNKTHLFNNKGYRGRNWENTKKNNDFDIFLIGGSTMFSLLSSEEESIHYLLENNLNKKNSKINYRVFNASLPGKNSMEEYKTFYEEVINYNPDIIIFLTGYNNAGIRKLDYPKETIYSNFLYQIGNFLTRKTFLEKTGILIINASKSNTYVSIISEDQLIKFSTKSNNLCKINKIKCFFLLQPSLQIQSKALTESERYLKMQQFGIKNPEVSTNFKKSYEIFRKHFQKNEFDYHDLTSLGNKGLYTGLVQFHNEKIFPNRVLKFLINSKNYNFSIQNFSVEVNDLDYNINTFCDEYKIELINDGNIGYTCELNSEKTLLTSAINQEEYAYADIIYSKKSEELIFKLNEIKFIDKLNIDFVIENHKDRENIIVETSISKDGKEFFDAKNFEKNYLNGHFKDTKFLENYSGDLFIKLKFKNDRLIGLKKIGINYYSFTKKENFFNTDSIKIFNNNKNEIYLEAFPLINNELFIDTAHLTYYGNKLISNYMSNLILN